MVLQGNVSDAAVTELSIHNHISPKQCGIFCYGQTLNVNRHLIVIPLFFLLFFFLPRVYMAFEIWHTDWGGSKEHCAKCHCAKSCQGFRTTIVKVGSMFIAITFEPCTQNLKALSRDTSYHFPPYSISRYLIQYVSKHVVYLFFYTFCPITTKFGV